MRGCLGLHTAGSRPVKEARETSVLSQPRDELCIVLIFPGRRDQRRQRRSPGDSRGPKDICVELALANSELRGAGHHTAAVQGRTSGRFCWWAVKTRRERGERSSLQTDEQSSCPLTFTHVDKPTSLHENTLIIINKKF